MSVDRLGAIYPLTPMQQGMLFHTLSDPASALYVEQLTCTLAGPLDADLFERAWQCAVDRHAILRTAFVWEGLDEPVQVVQEAAEMAIDRQDWSGLSPTERTDRLDAFLQADRRRGFRLADAPLARLTLIRIAEHEHWLVWSHHHILLDGWSIPLLLGDVFEAYEARLQHREAKLGPAVPYRDYVTWLRKQDPSSAEAYWRRLLGDFSAPTPLPWLDSFASRDVAMARGDGHEEHALRLTAETSEALRAFGRSHRLTLSTILQGAWALFLARTSGEDDVAFGVTASGRPLDLPGVETMVGLFINTLPLRVRVTRSPALVPWLTSIQAQQAEARAYEWSPLSQVQAWSGVPHGTALFDSIVVFENYPIDESLRRPYAGLEIRNIRSIERTNYSLTLAVVPGDRLTLALSYPRRRFDPDSITRTLEGLQTLLEGMIARPDARLGALPIVPESERCLLVAKAAGTREQIPCDGRVHDRVSEQAARTPNAVAIVSEGESVTYAEMERRAHRLARRLHALGVRPDVVVGLCLERSVDGIVAMLAILEAGGAYLPLDPSHPRERLAFQVKDAGAALVVTLTRHVPDLPAGVRTLCLDRERDAIAAESSDLFESGVSPSNLAYVIYTSGSTGTPKGVMVSHRGVSHRFAWGRAALPLDSRDSLLQKAAWSFDVSVWEIFSTLVAGARLVLARPGGEMDPAYLVRTIAAERITVVDFVPSLLTVFLDEPGVDALHSLRRVTCGGEALSAELVAKFVSRLPASLHNFYGPTETTIDATTWTIDRNDPDRKPPIGKPVGNSRIYILDSELELAPDGTVGEIVVGGPGVARGYLGQPDRTAEAFVPDPFGGDEGARLYRTGDLGRRLADGNVEFLGRRDDQVKLRGFRVELGEIEAALVSREGVREAAVARREDTPGNAHLAAYVVSAKSPAPDAATLRAFLHARLPAHLIPATFTFLDSLPRNSSGKVDRRALPIPDRAESSAAFVAARTEAEAKLAEIWASVLRVARVSVHEDFFALGGDSILAIQIVSKAKEAGLVLTPRHLFQHPTIEKLAAVAGTAEPVIAEQGPIVGEAPLTPIEHWFFEEAFADAHQWNQAVMLEVPRSLDPATIERALGYGVVHHDALRLRFTQSASGWTQTHAGLEVTVPFERHDVSALGDAARARAIENAAAAIQCGLDFSDGPLFRAAWFDLGADRPARLFLAIHHLAVDAVSWRILLEDLWAACEAIRRGDPIELPPKTTSFAEWSERLVEHARSSSIEAEIAHWLAEPRRTIAPLPMDFSAGANDQASARTVTGRLDAAETRALLQDSRAAYHTEVNDLLLAALALAFAKWTGHRRLLVDLEGHGREPQLGDETASPSVDLSRTVGWFTSVFPVLLDSTSANGPAETIKATKETLRTIPHRGIGYGLLRYVRGDAALAAQLRQLPQAEVSFNYVGQIDASLPAGAAFGWAKEPIGPCHSPAARRSHSIDVNASVTGGRLEVEWTYGEKLHRRETIELLCASYLESLRALVAHCQDPSAGSYTPSDFPDAGLDQKKLDRVLATVRQAKKGSRR
ncbi:MAG: amino acid adenylation domain-containing protein [Planctomycetes bacterium]|nr:amino acid adenylation domain-containing protein [Planctomycetota bacterium]MBI3847813.1 amino acid adenylation domain-containing protein [Planctomycetota bacterium]